MPTFRDIRAGLGKTNIFLIDTLCYTKKKVVIIMKRDELLDIINASRVEVLKNGFIEETIKQSLGENESISSVDAVLLAFQINSKYTDKLILSILEKVLLDDSQESE